MAVLAICMALAADIEFVNTTPHLDIATQLHVMPARLQGFDVLDSPNRGSHGEPLFRVAHPVRIQSHWTVENAFPIGFRVFVRVKGSGPAIHLEAPLLGTGEIQGATRAAVIPFDIPRFTHAGDGTLTIGLRWQNHEGTTVEVVSYRGHCYTSPINTTSKWSPEQLAPLFGPNATPLRSSFRLGDAARIRLPQNRIPDQTSTAIGFVSALHHSNKFKQGEAIAEIEVSDGSRTDRYTIRAGVHTSLSEYDVPRPGTLNIEKVAVASQKGHQGDRLTWDKKPLQLYSYYAEIPFDRPTRVTDIEVRYLADYGVVDLYELVLIPND